MIAISEANAAAERADATFPRYSFEGYYELLSFSDYADNTGSLGSLDTAIPQNYRQQQPLHTSISQLFSGSGVDDLSAFLIDETYTGAESGDVVFTVIIRADDFFSFRKATGAWSTPAAITGDPVSLGDNVQVVFDGLTGHTVGDLWTITVNIPSPLPQRFTWVTSRRTDGTAYLHYIDPRVTADWILATGDASCALSSYKTMRYGISFFVDNDYVYVAQHDDDGIQIGVDVAGNLAPSYPSIGPLLAVPYVCNSTKVCRVEAVCPTEDGSIIVAVGTHSFTDKRSTIEFYWLPPYGSAYFRLDAIIQMPLTDTYDAVKPTQWYDVAKQACYIHSFYVAETATIQIIANDQVRGRAVQFSLRHGIVSDIRAIVPINAESDTLALLANTTCRINDLFYMTARWAHIQTVGNKTHINGWDLLLISSDGWNWSFRERTSFLQKASSHGALLLDSGTGDTPTLYYGGNGLAISAVATKTQIPSLVGRDIWRQAVTSSADLISNAADKLSMEIQGNATAGGGNDLDGDARVGPGATIYVKAGTADLLEPWRVFSIDSPDNANDTKGGRAGTTIVARDLGGKTLIEYQAPIELEIEGRKKMLSSMTDIDAFTPLIDDSLAKVDSTTKAISSADGFFAVDITNHLLFKRVNTPAVYLLESDTSGNVLMRATVEVSTHDTGHLSSFGFVFGSNESGSGCVFMVPKTQVTPWGEDHHHVKPELRSFSLTAIDLTDPNKVGTGWNLKPYVSGLWEATLPENIKTIATPGTYTVQKEWGMAPGKTYDLVLRALNRRVQLFAKEHDYRFDHAAANSDFELIAEFMFDATAQRAQPGKDFAGLTLETATHSDEHAYSHACYQDISISVNRALVSGGQTDGSRNDDAYVTAIPGAWNHPSNDPDFYATTGCDMRNLEIGMPLYVKSNRNYTYITGVLSTTHVRVAGTGGTSSWWDFGSYGIVPLYFRTSLRSGTMSSGYETKTVYGGSKLVLDPPAKKTVMVLYGKAAIYANDNTAMMVRYMQSDGVTHDIYDTGSSWALTHVPFARMESLPWGLDSTNPIKQGDVGWNGSDPASWRVLFNHTGITKRSFFETKLLPTSGYMRAEEEIFSYEEEWVEDFAWNITTAVTFSAANQSAMLAGFPSPLDTAWGTPAVGDVCNRTDLSQAFKLTALPYSTLANWEVQHVYPMSAKKSYRKWLCIPTYYSTLAIQTTPSAIYVNWMTYDTTSHLWHQVGSDLGLIPNAITRHYMVEILDNNQTSSGQLVDPAVIVPVEKQRYVAAQHAGPTPMLNTDPPSITSKVYDKVYGDLQDDTPEVGATGALTVAIISGRGAFGTGKVGHAATTPVYYWPCDDHGLPPWIKVSRFDLLGGMTQTIQDAVKRIAGLAGMRKSYFRTLHTDPLTSWTATVSSDKQSMPLRHDVVNFCLEADVHLPGNGVVVDGETTTYTSDYFLHIEFRDYYRLSLRVRTEPSDIDAGKYGVIDVGLSTTHETDEVHGVTGGVNPAGDPELAWLERAHIPLTDYDISGVHDGESNYDYTDDPTKTVHLRLVVENELVTVEIDNAPLWTFNLENFRDESGTTPIVYRYDTAGPIKLSYSGGSYAVSAFVVELGTEVRRYVVRRASTAGQAVSAIAEDRVVKWRSSADGGVEFSRFWDHDDLGSVVAISKHSWQKADLSSPTSVGVTGANDVAGMWANESDIRERGDRYLEISHPSVQTIEEANAIAQLTAREMHEQASPSAATGALLHEAQPEDKVTIEYAPPGDAPQWAITKHVITQLKLSFDQQQMSYSLRGDES